MSKRCKSVLYAILGGIVLVIAVLILKFLFFSGLFVPLLQINGSKHIQMEVNDAYKEKGVKAIYRFANYEKEVKTASNVNTKKLGTYEVTYTLEKYNKKAQRKVSVVDTKAPKITLQGSNTIRVFENTPYQDPGYEVIDNYDGDITQNVKVENNVDMKKQGTYKVLYHISDSSGNESSVERSVQVCADPTSTKLYYNHDDYDNKAEEWWFTKSKDHVRMSGAKDEQWLKKYDAYMMGPEEKVIYLTFDEGGNDITYIKEIADVLKKNDVVATYFLTRNYIKDNPEFINDLVKDGNVIGNHTWHHYDMTTLANSMSVDKFVAEISETEKTYMEVTGEAMKKIFRFPKGGSSERAYKLVQDLGYSTYNWSHAYYDYANDVSRSEALKTLMDHYHEGAIYLLHPSNKGNFQAMDAFVKNMKELGYTFKTVDTIPTDTKK